MNSHSRKYTLIHLSTPTLIRLLRRLQNNSSTASSGLFNSTTRSFITHLAHYPSLILLLLAPVLIVTSLTSAHLSPHPYCLLLTAQNVTAWNNLAALYLQHGKITLAHQGNCGLYKTESVDATCIHFSFISLNTHVHADAFRVCVFLTFSNLHPLTHT